MRLGRASAYGAAICCCSIPVVRAIQVDLTSDTSVKSVASTIAYGMMKYYTGNNTGDNPGNLPEPYYWWEAGGMFGTMVEYWYYTNDTSYNSVVQEGLLSQIGDNDDYMPTNQTKTEGNDDQGFWGMAAMSAAEMKFIDPPSDKPGWVALAQAVFNTMVPRWDPTSCNGGLRWQIFTFNNGYNYKNAIANGCFFNIGARLARYTGNTTYSDWADKTWDWMVEVGLMTADYQVYDGAQDTTNCSDPSQVQFSYNAGVFLFGAAAMYDFTNDTKWLDRVNGLIKAGTTTFFSNSIMTESACETRNNCNTDQHTFKAYFSRWLAATSQLIPSTQDIILPLLKSSASAAASQCSGGSDGVTCGQRWLDSGKWDGTYGVGQQMSALSVLQSTLIGSARELVTNTTGGTSQGNPDAGAKDVGKTDPELSRPVTTADRVGAGILTFLVLVGLIGGTLIMVIGD